MIQEKEQLIVSTIFTCNKEIENFCKETKLFESNTNIYHFNMLSLYSNVIGSDFKNLNESILIKESYVKPNPRNNYYKYFKDVDKFLSGFHLEIQKNLNESLIIDDKKIENATTLDIFSFKKELKEIIDKLSKIDDFNKYTNTDIIKTKIFTNQPLFIYGFNIINNLNVQIELFKKFNITQNDIYSIIYNKKEKLLYFCTQNIIYFYNIKEDNFAVLENIKIDFKEVNYLQKLKEKLDVFTLYELYANIGILNLTFTDNLYNDIKFNEYVKFRKANQVVK